MVGGSSGMGVFLWICAARWAFDVALPSLNVANACLPAYCTACPAGVVSNEFWRILDCEEGLDW